MMIIPLDFCNLHFIGSGLKQGVLRYNLTQDIPQMLFSIVLMGHKS